MARLQGTFTAMSAKFTSAMAQLPLVAILRGVAPAEAEARLAALLNAGFHFIETPLNSPEPFETIRRMRALAPATALIGAGTVLNQAQVEAVAAAGGDLVVMPHMDADLIRFAKAMGMSVLPGVATPSEAFAAMAAGADGLKAFPAEMIPPAVLKAWRAVIPPATPILPVGGIAIASMAPYHAAGASGFGLGSALYRPGDSTAKIAANALAFAQAWRRLAP